MAKPSRRGFFGHDATLAWTAIGSIAGVLALVLGVLTYVNDVSQDKAHPPDPANTSKATSAAKSPAPDAAPAESEWSGSVRVPTDAAVDLDATPPYVDKLRPHDNANEFVYDGDGTLSFTFGFARAAVWRDASDPSESQCVTAIDHGSNNSVMTVEAGQRLCVKVYEDGGVRYAYLTVDSATSRTLAFDMVRWAVHSNNPDAGSNPRDEGDGHWSGWALFWWSLLAIALIGIAGFAGGLLDAGWAIPFAVLVLVGWLIIVWTSMAWWAMLLVVVLAVVAFLAMLAFGIG